MSVEHEVHYPSNARITNTTRQKVVLSCSDNKVSELASTTRHVMAQGTYVPNIRFVCYQQQTYEGITLLPWIQGFHSYKLHHFFLLPQWTTPPNLKFIDLQIAMLQQYVSVAMITIFHSNL